MRHKLSATTVKTKKVPGLYADGAGLYLQVAPAKDGVTKSWVLRYKRQNVAGGRARKMGLGSYPEISLDAARDKALKERAKLFEGIDPIAEREARLIAEKLSTTRARTFRQCAEQYMKAHEDSWRNATHRTQWHSSLRTYVYPVFGELPVHEVDLPLVLKVIEPIWREKTETANRVRGRIETVLAWATVRGFRKGDNPARWQGHLDTLLPQRSKIQPPKHHPALPYEELPAFMAQLRDMEGVSARALELTILSATRTSETIGARWSEIDFGQRLWTIPAKRMKAGKDHRIPLSDRALKLLSHLPREKGSDFVFIGKKAGKPLSDMALFMSLRRMDRQKVTVHGFRSTFRDWAAEQTAFPNHVVEQALAHAIGNAVEAAYRRGDLFEKRRKLMDAWARYCAAPAIAGNVVAMRQGEAGA